MSAHISHINDHRDEPRDRWIHVADEEEDETVTPTAVDLEIRATDTGNTRRLINRHGANLRYVAQWKSWYIWHGHYWERDLTGEVMRRAQETVRHIYVEAASASDSGRKELARWAMQSEAKERIKAMVSLAEFQPEVAVTPDDFDAQPWLLNCRNVTIDLRTGETKAHDRRDMLTSALDFDYDPTAECPTFLRFLDRIMGGNAALIAFLQRAIGYSLTADIREECIFVPWGGGSNGKSTLLNVIRDLTGAYSRTMSPDTLAASNHRNGSGPSSDIARLKGARFISAIETDEGQRLNESLIKQLTSREPITARFLNQEDFEFAPTWKLWLATNHKPTIRGTDKGIWRRIKLIPFNVTITEDEKKEAGDIAAKLRGELSGILNWAILGCLAWQQNGLGVPEEVKQATNEYKNEMDVLGAFLGECCIIRAGCRVSLDPIYDEYREWCEEGREHQLKKREFTKRLEERGFSKARTQANGGNQWQGIGLKTDYPDLVPSVDGPVPSVNDDVPSVGTVSSVPTNPEFNGTPESLLKELKTTEANLGVKELGKKPRMETPKNASVSFSSSVSSVSSDDLIFSGECRVA